MSASADLVVDFDAVRANTLGDEAFERRLLEAFLDDNVERLARAREALRTRAAEDLHREAHSLKGAAATLGATPLASAAQELEAAAAEGRFDLAPALFETVEHELRRVHGVLQERLKA